MATLEQFLTTGMALTHILVVADISRAHSNSPRRSLAPRFYREYGGASCVLTFMGLAVGGHDDPGAGSCIDAVT